MTPQEYEKTTSEIAQSIFERVEGIDPKQVRYGNQNRLQGKSGYKHQIDVSVEGLNDLILIECKYWDRRVSAEAILTFLGRIHDIKPMFDKQIHSVIVTNVGFQSGVKQLAKYYEIDLQIISSARAFGFMYKDLLLIKPTSATLKLSASNPSVFISESKNKKR
ncbi:MAG: restriction endonuclease [Ardenticatenaceae bacterium]|nr:restriction endonuclease [Ardenticatenaceae bacterium]